MYRLIAAVFALLATAGTAMAAPKTPNKLAFNYRVDGDKSVAPVNVYTRNNQVYMLFPDPEKMPTVYVSTDTPNERQRVTPWLEGSLAVLRHSPKTIIFEQNGKSASAQQFDPIPPASAVASVENTAAAEAVDSAAAAISAEQAKAQAEEQAKAKAKEEARLKAVAETSRRDRLTLRVADGQWLPEAIGAYLLQQPQPMDLEWNAPSQFRPERGLAFYADQPQQAVFNVVRNFGLSVCVWKGNVKPVVEVFPAGSDEEKCRD